MFGVPVMDTSFLIVLQGNWWHSVKRALSCVYLNWQQLEVHFILIYQLWSWSNWIQEHFHGGLLPTVVLRQANAELTWNHTQTLAPVQTACRMFSYPEWHHFTFSCTSSKERSPQGQDNRGWNRESACHRESAIIMSYSTVRINMSLTKRAKESQAIKLSSS